MTDQTAAERLIALDSGPPVGAQLRERRFAVGMSLRELARRIEVSPSLVSQIETGKIQPSVRTLIAIVSELGMSVDQIFERAGLGSTTVERGTAAAAAAVSESAGAASVCRSDERREIRLETGIDWQRMITWEDPEVEFIIAVYGPGGSSSPDGTLMRHAGREFGLVLNGTLHVTVGFEEHVLEPGDSISFRSMVPHRLHNEGDEEVRAVWVSHGRYEGD
ncbi:MAG TPA: XRE family transcriptional regulator [Solirubrobacteraceae bacterium]|nr:XRE family transcriptional regulator [Solirubrobacteraceae bacterium]